MESWVQLILHCFNGCTNVLVQSYTSVLMIYNTMETVQKSVGVEMLDRYNSMIQFYILTIIHLNNSNVWDVTTWNTTGIPARSCWSWFECVWCRKMKYNCQKKSGRITRWTLKRAAGAGLKWVARFVYMVVIGYKRLILVNFGVVAVYYIL
jgi:hypothetical protein